MPITMAGIGEKCKIQKIGGNEETRRFLANLGFVNEAEVSIVSAIGGNVIVRDPPPHIRRVIRLSGMERIAQIQIQKPSCREGDFGIGGGENA